MAFDLSAPGGSPDALEAKGVVDATLAANLPASPDLWDVYIVSVAGDFEDDASILPAAYDLTVGDGIMWDGTNWLVRESGDDSMKTTLNLSDLDNVATARTNLDVYNKAEVEGMQPDLDGFVVGGKGGHGDDNVSETIHNDSEVYTASDEDRSPASLVDPATTTWWQSDFDLGLQWCWIQVEYGNPVVLNKYRMDPDNSEPSYVPALWDILGSNDGVSYDVLASGETGPGGYKGFRNYKPYKYYRAYIYSNVAGSARTRVNYFAFVEAQDNNITLEDGSVTVAKLAADTLARSYTKAESDATLPIVDNVTLQGNGGDGALNADFNDLSIDNVTAYTASSGTGVMAPASAFERDDLRNWQPDNGFPAWLKVELNSSYVSNKYRVRSGASPSLYPQDWTFEGSNDDAAWDVLDTVTGETWSSWQTKTYTFTSFAPYKYYRINVSGSPGGSVVQINEFYIYKAQKADWAVKDGSITTAKLAADALARSYTKAESDILIPNGDGVTITTTTEVVIGATDDLIFAEWLGASLNPATTTLEDTSTLDTGTGVFTLSTSTIHYEALLSAATIPAGTYRIRLDLNGRTLATLSLTGGTIGANGVFSLVQDLGNDVFIYGLTVDGTTSFDTFTLEYTGGGTGATIEFLAQNELSVIDGSVTTAKLAADALARSYTKAESDAIIPLVDGVTIDATVEINPAYTSTSGTASDHTDLWETGATVFGTTSFANPWFNSNTSTSNLSFTSQIKTYWLVTASGGTGTPLIIENNGGINGPTIATFIVAGTLENGDVVWSADVNQARVVFFQRGANSQTFRLASADPRLDRLRVMDDGIAEAKLAADSLARIKSDAIKYSIALG